MRRIVLVTGGARSGKSSFAESLLRDASEKVYIATAPVCDDEMAERVRLHKLRREKANWRTIEEEINLPSIFDVLPAGTAVLTDCLTLWISNLIWKAEQEKRTFSESDMAAETEKLIRSLRRFDGTAVFVINEVGLGIVPDNPLSRLFRDCSGRCSQMMAAEADELYFLVCGIPQRIK